MIVVDSGIWIDDLRAPDSMLAALLLELRALLHPFVLGEIALGSLPRREPYLREMRRLPRPSIARHLDVVRLIASETLHGTGIGYVDAHLLASCRLMPGSKLWTGDKRLNAQAERLGIAFTP